MFAYQEQMVLAAVLGVVSCSDGGILLWYL